MKVAVMEEKRRITIVEKTIPEIKEDEVLIRIRAAGVCGSDLHYYTEGRIGDMEVEMPFVLGHEVCGTIEKKGSKVTGLNEGQLVAIEPGIPCGDCEFCRSGHYNLCPEVRFLATPPIDGAFAEYVSYPAKWVFPLPDGMTAIEGALVEPLAVGMHATEIAGASLGDTAFVFGCGCIGLTALLALKSRGVAKVYMSDMIQARREKALALGASEVFDPSRDNIAEKIQCLTDGRGVDSVYEMTGNSKALFQTMDLVRKGGVIVLVGMGSESIMPFDFGKLIWNEVQIRTCFRYKNIYPKAIRAIAAKQIDVMELISNQVTLDELPEALEYHVENKAEVIKMVVEM